MTQVVAEGLHAAAVLAALNAVLPAGKKAYDTDALARLKPNLPDEYVEVVITRRAYSGSERLPSGTTAGAWRALTRSVSLRSITNARQQRNWVHDALERKRLAIGGKRTTPIKFETAEPIGPDEGAWSGYEMWTYVL